jgi:SAM-dependent methyltransferase
MNRNGERTVVGLISDRVNKHGLYSTASYWNMKAESYSGFARSNWPSNAYNAEVHRTQMSVVDRALGSVRGKRVLDVGCGTGRAAAHLARRGARVAGWDFAERALDAARTETSGLEVDLERRNVLDRPPKRDLGRFDVVLSIGCLALACRDTKAFDRALSHLVSVSRPGGRILLLEPIHRSRLLRRILGLGELEWVERAKSAGLTALSGGRMCFVPTRFLLAFRELPSLLVQPLFRAGESALSVLPARLPLADYTWLLFERPRSPLNGAGPQQ